MRFRRWRHSEIRIACRSGCLDGPGAKMTWSSLRASGSVRPFSVFFSHPPRLQDQEPQRQQDQGHMVVKAAPAPDLIVVQPQFLFATQKTVLDGPAGMPGLHNSNRGQFGLALLK